MSEQAPGARRRPDRRREQGQRAERQAEKLLKRHGLKILARNWRGSGGELDLAALDGETLVFVEVKSRTAGFDPSRAPVSAAQRRRTAQAARAFRDRFGVRHLPFRFDLITVTGDTRRPDRIEWQRNQPHAATESS